MHSIGIDGYSNIEFGFIIKGAFILGEVEGVV